MRGPRANCATTSRRAPEKGRGLSALLNGHAPTGPLRRMLPRPDAAGENPEPAASARLRPAAVTLAPRTHVELQHDVEIVGRWRRRTNVWRRVSKTGAGIRATKGHQPEGDVGEAKNKHLLPPPQSEEAEFDPLC